MRNLTEFGAFVEITDEIDGLIHVSDMSWTKRVKHPSEVLKKGDDGQGADHQHRRRPTSGSRSPSKSSCPTSGTASSTEYAVGDTVDGKVVNVTDFGLFIDIFQGLEGLAHISARSTSR